MTRRKEDFIGRVTDVPDLRLITLHTLKRWKRKVNHLGFLDLFELRQATENLREDMLAVLKTLGDK